MTLIFKIKSMLPLLVLSSSVIISGCGGSDSKDPTPVVTPPPVVTPTPVTYQYSVTVKNLTNAQIMSPIAVVLHDEGQLWQLGQAASSALELLAESGDNSAVLADEMVLAGQSGVGGLPPGMQETITVSIEDTMPQLLSVATMLVNTNDAFSGINAMVIKDLAVDESISMQTSSYDSGTEMNSELMATIPGPAGGGEGYNEIRDDVDFVAMHSGIVSQDDGLMQSALTQAHRFDNPTLMITVTRTE
jgi:hypothetical protein